MEPSAFNPDQWKQIASEAPKVGQAFIDGKYVWALSGKTFDCVSPIDGKKVAQVAACEAADVDLAVEAARRAFEAGGWRHEAPSERKRVLLAFADQIRKHRTELAALETLDVGKPIQESYQTDIRLVADCIQWFAECTDKVYDEVAPTGASALALITREPVGVVGAVVPWNFPLLMAAWKLGPALAMGNSVVLKPAEQSPLTALRLGELANEAGLPPGVLNIVPGFGETAGQAIGLHPGIDAVGFTGSTQVGKFFLEYAGRSNMKRVSLECGGKSPHIVLADCPDLDEAAAAVASGIFYNQGEVCNAGSRLVVESAIKGPLLERVLALTGQYEPGNPWDWGTPMGAMVDAAQFERVLRYIEQGRSDGARVLAGGEASRRDTGGYYIRPTVFDAVSNRMSIAREEIFGPVLSVLEVDSLEQAIAVGNDTDYGLAAAVWTVDVKKAHIAARALRAGTVWVNCFDHGSMAVPFGGYKQSGIGRDKSLHALDKYTEVKTTWLNLS